MPDPEILPTLRKGERITAEHYAAVTAAARRVMSVPFGEYSGQGTSIRINPRMPDQVQIKVYNDTAKYEVLQLLDRSPNVVSAFPLTTFDAGTTDSSDYPKIFVTSDVDNFTSGGTYAATLIGRSKPIKVLSDTSDPPLPISTCGPVSGSRKVSQSGTGLVCLSAADGNGLIDVIASADAPASIIVFEILSMISDSAANCRVVYKMCGGRVVGATGNNTVIVYDDGMQCLFNEDDPTDGYIGRRGVAGLMDTVYAGNCRYIAWTLCCDSEFSVY